MNSLHRGYNFDLDRYGWHSTDYQGVLLTVARVRSTTPRYSINQLGRRCQQRCLNSGHVIRQQPSWTANVEPLPLFPSRIYIHWWWKIDDSTVRVSTTDRHQPSETDSRPISFFLLLLLSPSLSSFFCRLTLAQFFAPRVHDSLAHNETFVRYLDTVRKQLYVSTRTHVTRATINFIHLTTFLLLSPSLSFILSPVFLV